MDQSNPCLPFLMNGVHYLGLSPWAFKGKRWAYEWKGVRRKKGKIRSCQSLGEFREKGECQPEMPLPDLWAERSYLWPLSIFLFSVLKVFFLTFVCGFEKKQPFKNLKCKLTWGRESLVILWLKNKNNGVPSLPSTFTPSLPGFCQCNF